MESQSRTPLGRTGAAALASVVAATTILVGGLFTSASASVGQETIPGNPDCEDLGFSNEFKIEASGEFPDEGTYADGDEGTESKGDTEGFSVEITYTDDDPLTFDFDATIAVNAVLVKAGPNALAYTFDPPSTHGAGLVSPVDDSISHITFCWDTTTTTTSTTAPGATTTVPGGGGGGGDSGASGAVPPAATPVVGRPGFAG
jgi:hypothetical protein